MRFNIQGVLKLHGLNLDTKELLYHNLYEALRSAILKRSLPPESKLPPTRVLASDLGISRSTVLKAYGILALENFIVAKKGAGYFIPSPKKKKLNFNFELQEKKGEHPEISMRAKSFMKYGTDHVSKNDKNFAFKPGMPPVDIFPVQIWRKLIGEYWHKVTPSQLSYSHSNGLPSLRKNLAYYLKIHRNIDCSPEQILVTSGSVHSLYLATNILLNPQDEILLENPTFTMASQLFQSLEAKLIPMGVDKEGIQIPKDLSISPKLIYTTPSNQFPTGIKMSMARRVELLKWASKKGAILIEDDYDQEFSNWDYPMASLFNLDKQQRVIYMGTFNKLTHPSMRLGYMIVPPYLIDALSILHTHSSRFVSVATQKTMSDFIEKDYLSLHLRNLIHANCERKKIFIEEFQKRFHNQFDLQTQTNGLHLTAKPLTPIPDTTLEKVLAHSNINVGSLSRYYLGNKKVNGMLLGHAACNPLQIKKNLDRMQEALRDILANN